MTGREWDEMQESVLSHAEGPLLVLGGAGTGKTQLLVELVARRLHEDTTPALALCLSRKAASEVRDRVVRASGRTTLQPSAMTLHSFCLTVLERHGDEEDHPPRLLTAPEQEFRIRELLAGCGPGLWPESLVEAFPTHSFARQVRAALARARQLGLDPEDLVDFGQQARDPAWRGLGRFMAEYLDVLDAEGVLDYAELVHRARVLLERPETLASLRRQFGAVYVDEFAELDPAQLALLRALVGEKEFVAFADPDTAIFRFRGAHPRAVGEFVRLFGGPVVTLGRDHRRGAVMRAVGGAVARRLGAPALEAKVIRDYRAPDPVRGGCGRVEALTFPDASTEASRIAEELRAAHLEGGTPWHDMAVLVRSGRRQIPALARALTDAGIPVEVAGDEIGLAEHPAVRPLLLALELAARGGLCDADEAHRLLTSGWGGMDAVAIRTLGRLLRASARERSAGLTAGDLIASALSGREPLPAPPAETAPASALAILAARRALLARASEEVAAGRRPDEVLWLVWSATPWPEELRAAALSGTDLSPRAHRDLDAVCALFDLARQSQAPSGVGGVRSFLAEVAAQQIPADMERESAIRGRGVRVLTAHRAKGHEWPFVVVAGVQEGVWPDVGRQGSLFDPERLTSTGLGLGVLTRDLVATERRLFLLAISRASERLLVTAVSGTEGEADQPSRFVAELGVPVRHEKLPPDRLLTLRALIASLRATSVDPAASPELRTAAAVRLARLASEAEQGRPLAPDADPDRWWGVKEQTSRVAPADGQRLITPSRLSSLLTCPLQYFLSREARADPPRSSSAILGSVIHALAEHALKEELTREGVLSNLDGVWAGIPFPAPWFSLSERVAAEQAVGRFMGWQEARRDMEVIGVEVRFRAEIEVDGESVTIAGTVDRLERTASGALRIIDFKSARTLPTAAEASASEQLGLYQLAVEAGGFGAGAISAGVELVYLRFGDDDYPKVFTQEALSVRPHLTDDPEELAYPTWVHHRIAQARRTLEEGRFDAMPGPHCRWCAFASSCPAKSGQVIQ